jgi:hypothetical protein
MSKSVLEDQRQPRRNIVLNEPANSGYVWRLLVWLWNVLPLGGLRTVLTFAYYCFLKPLGKHAGQGERLDRFYEGQAGVYDTTRTALLKGRETMLRMLAAEVQERQMLRKGLVWVDVGGGTGKPHCIDWSTD